MIGANCYRGESERRRGDTKIASMGKTVNGDKILSKDS